MSQVSKWDRRWLGMAEYVSTFSKDPSTQVGAIIARNKEFLGFGYNGFPEGMSDHEALYEDREYKYTRILHAEPNAIKNSWSKDLNGATIYTYPFQPCSKCALQIINHGIKRVISLQPPKDKLERWAEDFALTKELFIEGGVELIIV